MQKSKFSEEQIIRILKENEAGIKVTDFSIDCCITAVLI